MQRAKLRKRGELQEAEVGVLKALSALLSLPTFYSLIESPTLHTREPDTVRSHFLSPLPHTLLSLSSQMKTEGSTSTIQDPSDSSLKGRPDCRPAISLWNLSVPLLAKTRVLRCSPFLSENLVFFMVHSFSPHLLPTHPCSPDPTHDPPHPTMPLDQDKAQPQMHNNISVAQLNFLYHITLSTEAAKTLSYIQYLELQSCQGIETGPSGPQVLCAQRSPPEMSTIWSVWPYELGYSFCNIWATHGAQEPQICCLCPYSLC